MLEYALDMIEWYSGKNADKSRLVSDWLKDRVQPKQEWSEEDEKIYRGIHNLIYSTPYCDSRNELSDWLKSLKERVQPQPKQEWSKNDIDMIDWLIRCCEMEHKELCNDKYGHQDIVSYLKRDCRKKWDWLESLKSRVALQKQWKPNALQIKALDTAICLNNICASEEAELRNLLEQLKKL